MEGEKPIQKFPLVVSGNDDDSRIKKLPDNSESAGVTASKGDRSMQRMVQYMRLLYT